MKVKATKKRSVTITTMLELMTSGRCGHTTRFISERTSRKYCASRAKTLGLAGLEAFAFCVFAGFVSAVVSLAIFCSVRSCGWIPPRINVAAWAATV